MYQIFVIVCGKTLTVLFQASAKTNHAQKMKLLLKMLDCLLVVNNAS